jgi:hypothetical protein
LENEVIEGTVFHDRGRNGRRDSVDEGLAGQRVYLVGPKDDSTETDRAGRYRFEHVPQGFCMVIHAPPQGWYPTTPTRDVVWTSRDRAYEVETFREFSRLAAEAYAGLSLTGSIPRETPVRRPGDPRIALYNWGRGAITAARGGISFNGTVCDDGSIIPEQNRPEHNAYVVGISPFVPSPRNRDFGEFPLGVGGRVLLTLRGGESGLVGWNVRIQGASSSLSAVTDSSGFYSFHGVEWGRNEIRLNPHDEFAMSMPSAMELPDEPRIEQRHRMRAGMQRIWDRANVSFQHTQGYNVKGYYSFVLPPEMREDDDARYYYAALGKESCFVSARSKDGPDSLASWSGVYQLFENRFEASEPLQERGRALRGVRPTEVREHWSANLSGDVTWLDLRVAPLRSISGTVTSLKYGSSGSGGCLVRVSGPSRDSIRVGRDGLFRTKVLLPGPYVICATDATADVQAEGLSRRLSECVHHLCAIAADATRFLVEDRGWGGGAGIYGSSYRLPHILAEAPGWQASVVSAPTDMLIEVTAADAQGTVKGCLDQRGIIRDLTITGAFQSLRPVVVCTDGDIEETVGVTVPLATPAGN